MARIDEAIFQKLKPDISRLIKFGFRENKLGYQYRAKFMDDQFCAEITIDMQGKTSARIIDLDSSEEYTPAYQDVFLGSFVSAVREKYREILKNIAENCYIKMLFIHAQANRIAEKVEENYHEPSDNPFKDLPNCCVFRNAESRKWYCIFLTIPRSKLIKGNNNQSICEEMIEIINLKIDCSQRVNLHQTPGIYPAYHMNHQNWISIILNDTVSDEKILELVDTSRNFTLLKKSKGDSTAIG